MIEGRQIISKVLRDVLIELDSHAAGTLRANSAEYATAARYAYGCGRLEFTECLLRMAEVEWEHEQYFRAKVLSDAWGRHLPIWPPPGARFLTASSLTCSQRK